MEDILNKFLKELFEEKNTYIKYIMGFSVLCVVAVAVVVIIKLKKKKK